MDAETRARWRAQAQAAVEVGAKPLKQMGERLLMFDAALTTAERERDAMRPVVEAAVRWRHLPESEWDGATESLEDVIDAYEAAQ